MKIFGLFTPRRRERIKVSDKRSRELETEHLRVRAQWSEVQALGTYSREQREMNHLTELFFQGSPE